jgi:hypothetical protein
MKLDLLKVICPACSQQVEAIARYGRVKVYRAAETKAEMSAGLVQIKEDRDSRRRFIKGNVPLNKRAPSS